MGEPQKLKTMKPLLMIIEIIKHSRSGRGVLYKGKVIVQGLF